MRFIIHEQPFEKPLATGQFRYERDGAATGAVETWRYTTASQGFRFLRVDLDARDAPSGHTYLYHAVLDENGRITRLQYRFWGDGWKIRGNVLLEEDSVVNTRLVNGVSFSEEEPFTSEDRFWFPAVSGLGLLADLLAEGMVTAVSLRTDLDDPNTAFRLFTTPLHVARDEPQLTLRWENQIRTLWLDENGHPLRMERGDGLTAVATRHVQYR
jgi:hypothetical protein